jgi:hypothetical protein
MNSGGRVSAVTSPRDQIESKIGVDRRVPTWAAAVIARLSRDLPTVVTREDISQLLTDAGTDRTVDATISELRRLGWLVGLPVHGVWAFIPPGQESIADPYLGLRAWHAREANAGFMLAGAAVAWHLGYLDRAPDQPTDIWLPATVRLPDGLRPYVATVHIKWTPEAVRMATPVTALLIRRKLDIVSWASGLPAFGPEALIVQLATRPSSFLPWADLVAHLNQLVADCDDDRLATLLAGQSTSAWQRAAYLLHAGNEPDRGSTLLSRRPRLPMPKIRFGHPAIDATSTAVWVSDYHLLDGLIAPLQLVLGKA